MWRKLKTWLPQGDPSWSDDPLWFRLLMVPVQFAGVLLVVMVVIAIVGVAVFAVISP